MSFSLTRSLQHRFGLSKMTENKMTPRNRQGDPGISRSEDKGLFGHHHGGFVLDAAKHQTDENQAQMDRRGA